jgi:hypothetical protein
MENFGVMEMVRTGRVAMLRGSSERRKRGSSVWSARANGLEAATATDLFSKGGHRDEIIMDKAYKIYGNTMRNMGVKAYMPKPPPPPSVASRIWSGTKNLAKGALKSIGFADKQSHIRRLAEGHVKKYCGGKSLRKYCGKGKPGPCADGETPVGASGTYQRAGQPKRSAPSYPVRPGQGNVPLGRSLKNVALGTGLVAKAAGKAGLAGARVAAKAIGTGAKVGLGAAKVGIGAAKVGFKTAKAGYKAAKWLKDALSTQQVTIQAKPKPLPPPRVVTSNFWSQGPAQQIVAPGKQGPAPKLYVPGWGRTPKRLA